MIFDTSIALSECLAKSLAKTLQKYTLRKPTKTSPKPQKESETTHPESDKKNQAFCFAELHS